MEIPNSAENQKSAASHLSYTYLTAGHAGQEEDQEVATPFVYDGVSYTAPTAAGHRQS
jgi:hypothetical protein